MRKVAFLLAISLLIFTMGCGASTEKTDPNIVIQSESSIALTPQPADLEVKLVKSDVGVNAMMGYVFYEIEINSSYWWRVSSEERDETARMIIAEYDVTGLDAGYDEAHSIVTAFVGYDFAFGEEYLGDGFQITVFDNKTAKSARRITL